ncbi:hypothetical protein Droror1_Dr00014465 [Drosera rotundifolia]
MKTYTKSRRTREKASERQWRRHLKKMAGMNQGTRRAGLGTLWRKQRLLSSSHALRIMTFGELADPTNSIVEPKCMPGDSHRQTEEEILKLLHKTRIRHAHLALKLYHEQPVSVDQELELVRPIATHPSVRRCLCYHMNFIAKPKNDSDDKIKMTLFY